MSLPTVTAIGTVKFKEYKQGDNNICSFILSCSEKQYKGDGYDNFNAKVTTFGKSADFVNQYFNDGDIAEVVGKLETQTYEKKDGTKGTSIQFKLANVSFVPKARAATGSESPVIHETIKRETPLAEDELPF